MTRVAIIGSGPSGLAAALSLVERGVKPVVIDAGETLDAKCQSMVDRIAAMPKSAWSRDDLAALTRNPSLGGGRMPRKLNFGSDYFYGSSRPQAPIEADAGLPLPSYAAGGYSVAWGAAILPAQSCDTRDWPVDLAEMNTAYARIMAVLPQTGGPGTLEQEFPSFGAASPLPLSPQVTRLLEDLKDSNSRLGPTVWGAARLALSLSPGLRTDGCDPCDLCLSGCPRGAIFSTLPTLEMLHREGRIEYRPGLYAQSLAETETGVELAMLDSDGEVRCEHFQALFVAAGAINTTRLMLRSRQWYGRPVTLKESRKLLIPMLRLADAPGALDQPGIALANVFIETKVPEVSDHWVHLQVFPMGGMMMEALGLKQAGLGRRLLAPLLRRTMVAWMSLHSDHSSHLRLVLSAPGNGPPTLALTGVTEARAIAQSRAVAHAVAWQGLAYGSLFATPVAHASPPGGGNHVGGSFPMRHSPTSETDTDTLGRPFGWKRVFLVDSSVLPSIPATTITLPTMANAWRIAAAAPLDAEPCPA